MTRPNGLPRRTLSDQADRSSSHRSVSTFLSVARKRSTLAISAASLLIPAVLGVAPARQGAQATTISAPAAQFAAASLVGAIGDPVGISAEANLDTALGWSGTLTFGDPTDPGLPVNLPPLDTLFPATPGDPAPAEPAQPAETPPAPEPASEAAPAPEAPPAEQAAPAPEAPAEAAPVSEAAPAPEAAPVEDESARIQARGIRASDIARTLVGSRYRYGGTGPRAFDCSGLTMYIYRQLGIALPHKASSQFSSRNGTIIPSMSDLKPGDLVYYKNTAGRGITHTAIYVGNGMMVTANSPRQGVRLSSIYDSYWRSHWAGGLRVRG